MNNSSRPGLKSCEQFQIILFLFLFSFSFVKVCEAAPSVSPAGNSLLLGQILAVYFIRKLGLLTKKGYGRWVIRLAQRTEKRRKDKERGRERERRKESF